MGITTTKGFKVNKIRNKFSPELQEAIILVVYELAQLKMMVNPIGIKYLPEI